MGDSIFGASTPVSTDNYDGTNYTLGTRFIPQEDGFVTKGRWYAPLTTPSSEVLPIGVYLWDERNTSAPIAETTIVSLTTGAWNEADFSSPVYVQGGITYTISVVTNRYTATTHYFDAPITSGYLLAPTSAGRFKDIGSSAIPQYPTDAFNAGGYFVDLVFERLTDVRNLAENPAGKNNATGMTGPGTPVRVTGVTGLSRTTGFRTTVDGYMQIDLGPVTVGQSYGVMFEAKNEGSVFEFGKTVYISYTTSGHGDQFVETPSHQLGAVGNVSRFEYVTNGALVPADALRMFLVFDSLHAGTTVTALMLSPDGEIHKYGDGDTTDWVWDGTDGNSSSRLDIGAPGVVWYVYNGSTEVPGTPYVWNGSTEVPVASYEIAP